MKRQYLIEYVNDIIIEALVTRLNQRVCRVRVLMRLTLRKLPFGSNIVIISISFKYTSVLLIVEKRGRGWNKITISIKVNCHFSKKVSKDTFSRKFWKKTAKIRKDLGTSLVFSVCPLVWSWHTKNRFYLRVFQIIPLAIHLGLGSLRVFEAI